jgi:voltage-gated potassium channel
VASALRPAVLDIIDLATHHKSLELQIEEIQVYAGSPCNGTTIAASGLCGKPGTILVPIKRASGEMVFNPADGEVINARDSLVALAEAERLKEIERMMGS